MDWPTSNEEWANAPAEFIREFVEKEGGAFDFDLLDMYGSMKSMYDEFVWSFDPAFEVSKLLPMMKNREEWVRWYRDERKYNTYGTATDDEAAGLYYDGLEEVLTQQPGALDPIICVEFRAPQPSFNGRAHTVNVGDGWHRTAISILKGYPTIRAIVGKHKSL